MILRIAVLSATLLLGVALIASASRTEAVPARESLKQFPMSVDGWRGLDEPDFAPDILAVLGVDEYVNRSYRSSAGTVGLYVGFYESQRQGDTMHSPMNCLPGAGWEPVSSEHLDIPVVSQGAPRTISVNYYVIEKGLNRHVVLYWYQSHGRVVANEYRSRVLMVLDAMKLNRTDAALVRVVSAVITEGGSTQDQASQVTVEFVNGRYEVVFDKNTPIALTLSGESGELAVDGTIEGTYQGTGADMTFTIGSVKGSAEVRYEGMSHTLPFDQVASQLGMDGAGSATCEGDKLTLKVGKTTFEMVRAA